MSGLRVLIVGASIAGPTAAYWFARAGANVTIIERFPALRTAGQNIDIRTVGVTVMRRMPGMEPAVRSKTIPLTGITLHGTNGAPIGTLLPTGNPDQQSLISEYEIYRGDLSQILYDLTSSHPRVTYMFNTQITTLNQRDPSTPITVSFTNNTTQEFDLIVAADGSNSRTRAMAFSCPVIAHTSPQNIWAAFFSIPTDLVSGDQTGHGYTAPRGRFVAIGADPAGGNRVTLMGVYPASAADMMVPFREALGRGENAVKRFIAEQFADAGWMTSKIIDMMMSEGTDFYANEMVRIELPSLFRGRVVCVGDAGYASGLTGMGTSLAMAGAYVLAGEIKRHGGDLEKGLTAYEEVMRGLVDKLGGVPFGVKCVMAPWTRGGLWVRNMVFGVACRSGIVGSVGKYFARAFDEKGALEEYDFGKTDQ
ncbi:hypothetical protein OQA88_953 [Cercophora sp. LCS_1]